LYNYGKNEIFSGTNCQNLVPMTEILHGIASDELTKYHLRSKASALETGGINMLKEKLLQQVAFLHVVLNFSLPVYAIKLFR